MDALTYLLRSKIWFGLVCLFWQFYAKRSESPKMIFLQTSYSWEPVYLS